LGLVTTATTMQQKVYAHTWEWLYEYDQGQAYGDECTRANESAIMIIMLNAVVLFATTDIPNIFLTFAILQYI
jgi:hypothetical protein